MKKLLILIALFFIIYNFQYGWIIGLLYLIGTFILEMVDILEKSIDEKIEQKIKSQDE